MVLSERKQRGATENRGGTLIGMILLLLAMFWVLGSGCRNSETDLAAPATGPNASGTENKADSAQDAGGDFDESATSNSSGTSAAGTGKRLEPIPNLTAEALLRDVLAVYRKAKLYSDHGYIEAVYRTVADPKRPISHRWPCSFTFKKPNFVRMEIVGGLLTCDGEKIRAKLLEPPADSRILELPAPLLFSSIRELYPDTQLADAMDLGTPLAIFWTPPSLILLLAKEPLKTLIPKDARPELLEPAFLSMGPAGSKEKTIVPCDRIAIVADDGTRILWINRETRGLVRFDFPLEQIPVPENVERILSLSMFFPNQRITEDPSGVELEAGLFSLAKQPDETTTDRLLPSELAVFGQPAPPLKLTPLVSGYSDLTLNQPDGKARVLCFWGDTASGGLSVRERSQVILREAARSAEFYANDSRVEFIAVNIDPASRSASVVRSEYGDTGLAMPLYRLRPNDLQKTILAPIAVPSLLLIDSSGVIQKYYSAPISNVKLEYRLKPFLDGKNIYEEDFQTFDNLTDRFHRTVDAAEQNDLYRIRPEDNANEPAIAAKESSALFDLKAIWKVSLLDAGNPLFIPGETSEKTPETASDSPQKNNARATEIPRLAIPCEGNKIALFDLAGKPIRAFSPETAAGEPISFLRTLRTQEGQRFFAASSFLDSRKIHLFGDEFDLLGTLDVSQPRQQWVGDLLLTDLDRDSHPELIMALIGDSAANLIPTHGIYAVPIQSEKNFSVLWKDEKILSPFRLGILPDVSVEKTETQSEEDGPGEKKENSGEKSGPAILAMNFPVDEMGKLVADSLADGSRIRQIDPLEDISIFWFAVAPSKNDKADGRIAALISHLGSDITSFALLDLGGNILRETPLPHSTWSPHLERIATADIDGDGETEWLVPTSEGTVYLFHADGEPLDRFSIGSEITGLTVAFADGRPLLILAGPQEVAALEIHSRGANAEKGIFLDNPNR